MSLNITPPVSPKPASPIIDARRNSLTSTRRLSNHLTEEPSASSQRHSPRPGAHTDLTASGEKTYHAESPAKHRDRLHHHAIPGASPATIPGLQDRNTDCASDLQLRGVSGTIPVSGIKIVLSSLSEKPLLTAPTTSHTIRARSHAASSSQSRTGSKRSRETGAREIPALRGSDLRSKARSGVRCPGPRSGAGKCLG